VQAAINIVHLHEVSAKKGLSILHMPPKVWFRRYAMPLPSMKSAKRCTAKAKATGQQCQNPVKGRIGRVCRLHGWRSPDTVRSGPDHPNFKHGEATKEAKAATAADLKQLRQVEAALKRMKVI
jgi:hypothetical protein